MLKHNNNNFNNFPNRNSPTTKPFGFHSFAADRAHCRYRTARFDEVTSLSPMATPLVLRLNWGMINRSQSSGNHWRACHIHQGTSARLSCGLRPFHATVQCFLWTIRWHAIADTRNGSTNILREGECLSRPRSTKCFLSLCPARPYRPKVKLWFLRIRN